MKMLLLVVLSAGMPAKGTIAEVRSMVIIENGTVQHSSSSSGEHARRQFQVDSATSNSESVDSSSVRSRVVRLLKRTHAAAMPSTRGIALVGSEGSMMMNSSIMQHSSSSSDEHAGREFQGGDATSNSESVDSSQARSRVVRLRKKTHAAAMPSTRGIAIVGSEGVMMMNSSIMQHSSSSSDEHAGREFQGGDATSNIESVDSSQARSRVVRLRKTRHAATIPSTRVVATIDYHEMKHSNSSDCDQLRPKIRSHELAGSSQLVAVDERSQPDTNLPHSGASVSLKRKGDDSRDALAEVVGNVAVLLLDVESPGVALQTHSVVLAIVGVLLLSVIATAVVLLTACFGSSMLMINCVVSFVVSVNYSCIFATIYDITVLHGGDAVLSGWIIGSNPCLNIFGNLVAWSLVVHYGLEVNGAHMCSSLSILGLSGITFWMLAANPSIPGWMLSLPCMTSGICCGLLDVFRSNVFEHRLHKTEIAAVMRSGSIANCVGLGFGPLGTSLGELVFTRLQFDRISALASASSYLTPMLILPICCVIYQCMTSVALVEAQTNVSDDCQRSSPQRVQNQRQHSLSLQSIAIGLAMVALQHVMLQFIESGSAILLQLVYGMRTPAIGITIGVALVCILPPAAALGRFLESPDISVQLMRLKFLQLGLVLACCLFVPVSLPNNRGWVFVIIGDILVFGIVAASSGVVTAGLVHAVEKRNWSWASMRVLYKLCFSIRCIGAVGARAIIKDSYVHPPTTTHP